MRLEIEGLSKSFGDHRVLEDVNLLLEDVRSLVIVGPSGGGKTTLLRILAGLEKPESGRVRINEHELVFRENFLKEYRKRVGMVFQAYNLFPHLTALENIALPLVKVHNMDGDEARQEAMSLLKRFDLHEHAHKKPAALSGGQKQRISISRAVAIKPEFLLFDEPTSALDPEYTAEVLDLIEELHEEGMQLILVTHEMGFARMAADHMLFVTDRGIPAQGRPEELFSSSDDPRVNQFFKKVLKY